MFTSISIGIACSRIEHTNPEEILRDADTAMYHAKARGKARHELFDADMHARALDRLGLENDLRQAVNNNDFEVHYQPIVSAGLVGCASASRRWCAGHETASRCRQPTSFPIAEELGLIESLGGWVLQESCRTVCGLAPEVSRGRPRLHHRQRVGPSAHATGFVHLVEQTVDETGMKPCDLRPRNHRDRAHAQSQRCRGGAAPICATSA